MLYAAHETLEVKPGAARRVKGARAGVTCELAFPWRSEERKGGGRTGAEEEEEADKVLPP